MTKRTFSLSFFFRKHIVAQYWWWHHHWFRQGHTQEMMSLQFYNTKYQENLLWAQLEHSGEFVFVYLCIIVYYCVLLCIIEYHCVLLCICVLLRPKKGFSQLVRMVLSPAWASGESRTIRSILWLSNIRSQPPSFIFWAKIFTRMD